MNGTPSVLEMKAFQSQLHEVERSREGLHLAPHGKDLERAMVASICQARLKGAAGVGVDELVKRRNAELGSAIAVRPVKAEQSQNKS
jgi:hypothetical protein